MQSYRSNQGSRPQRLDSATPASDRLELTDAARSFDQEVEDARAMQERIQQVRGQIENNTYLTEDKIDYVVDRLYAELTGDR